MQNIPSATPAVRKSRLRMVTAFLRTSIFFWLPVLLFVGLANTIVRGAQLPGDTATLRWLYQFSNPALDTLMIFITHLGSAVIVIPVLVAVCGLLYYKGYVRHMLFVLFSVGGTGLINLLFKLLFERSRPSLWEQAVLETGYSFPSGHAMISAAIAVTAIALLWHTKFRTAALIAGAAYCLLVSVSRLYLGVHYPSDILGGWCISLIWIMLLYNRFKAGFNRPKQATIPDIES